ncbi:MAG: 1-acyl-sn-glycerol-3-phosphate acyltransferase [Bacteroidales bacterium]
MANEKEQITTRHFIDLEKVIASKSDKLAKNMPGFILNYLKRIIHQEEINEFLYTHRQKYGLEFIAEVINYFDLDIPVTGWENLPETGRYVLASNHPLGGLDGMALMHTIGKKRQDFVFPVNDLLLFVPNVKDLFFPLNKHGKNTENIRQFDNTFASSQLILYFPAGLVSRKKKGIIKDPPWKKTFLTKAREHNRDIIPCHIGGRNSNFFYNLANIRVALGIKSNLEMLYLPNEMFKQTNHTVPITFGKPIPIEYFDRKKKKDIKWAAELREQVYALGNNKPLPIDL